MTHTHTQKLLKGFDRDAESEQMSPQGMLSFYMSLKIIVVTHTKKKAIQNIELECMLSILNYIWTHAHTHARKETNLKISKRFHFRSYNNTCVMI